MGQKGIHPLMRTMRVVMRNGASFNVQTTMNRLNPYMLQVDTSNNPIYTGESSGLSLEDERMQKLMSKYDGFIQEGEGSEVAVGRGDAGSSKAGGPPTKGGGKKKKK